MRVWHKDFIPYLPKAQLIAQWRELNSIFKNQNRHILINYIYKYPKHQLLTYSFLVIKEMYKKHIDIKSFKNMYEYFKDTCADICTFDEIPIEYIDGWLSIWIDHDGTTFKNYQNEDYLVKCYFNLKEKYDCGQKDFSKKQWLAIEKKFGSRVLAEVKRQLERKQE